MHRVSINGKIYYAENGTLLSDVIISSGETHPHPCGGMGTCKKCTLTVNGKKELSCRYKIYSDITVETHSESILSPTLVESEETEDGKNTALVLDIGTTTLALGVVDINTKKIIRQISDTNPQRVFGSDVISRIAYSEKNGVAGLNKILIEKINEMLSRLKDFSGETLYVSGNTVMLHLFFGIDCSLMGKAPYTPVFLDAKEASGEALGLHGIKTVYSLPLISAFIGADITAGLNLLQYPPEGKYSLFVDLGTNAEIVLFTKNRFLCTSAAAGPCFEGVNISCGMSAEEGAVFEYRSAGDLRTINGAKAKGICATGLIDIIAVLLKHEIIDKNGFMESESFRISDGVYLTREDIRQFQNAKSAIFSGIKALIQKEGITYADIHNLFVSGGFSHKLNIENAVCAGLFPKELINKFVPLNNSSLLGTAKFAAEKNDLAHITKNAEYHDLATNEEFAEMFIENMLFNCGR